MPKYTYVAQTSVSFSEFYLSDRTGDKLFYIFNQPILLCKLYC